jgi:hypothetical protein
VWWLTYAGVWLHVRLLVLLSAVDSKCFSKGLVAKVKESLQAYIGARPDVFTGFLLVLNTGPVEKEEGTFATRGKASIAGLKMGLSVRVQFVNGFLSSHR